ncbi:MAG: type VI secretion system tube protein Hcp [Saprospiraceae bacterium]|jgi:type VI secretion system secreted protein Hcp|nr:type VI secretion system tube protein Hcp [Saprospiraceae bacterium]
MKHVLFATLFAAAPLLVFSQTNRVAGPNKPQAAHVDYFLKIDGVDGESTDAKCRECIHIESFSWGATNPSATGAHGAGGGGGAGKVSVHDISITKMNDKSSPDLMQAAASGQHIKEAKLTCRKAGGDQQEYLTYTLEDVLVSSYSTSGQGSSSGRPMESLSLNFTKVTFQWTDASGKVKNLGAGQTPQSALDKFLKK